MACVRNRRLEARVSDPHQHAAEPAPDHGEGRPDQDNGSAAAPGAGTGGTADRGSGSESSEPALPVPYVTGCKTKLVADDSQNASTASLPDNSEGSDSPRSPEAAGVADLHSAVLEGKCDAYDHSPVPERYCIASFCSTEAGDFEAMAELVLAQLLGRTGKYYTIQVTRGVGRDAPAHEVRRRYSEFAELDKQIRPRFAGLPKLPVKSVFRKRFKPGFMDARERGLQDFINAVTAADPAASDPFLETFLGIGGIRVGAALQGPRS
mmetsp:Transcript_13319/g.38857  ORF Transcript_13319/g.38857 Transcript_13319/m.38857 type:complete len:265 (-) Transcript_13319:327-1121(-)